MGLFQAVTGAIGGTLSDQWLDFFGVPDGLPATAAAVPGRAQGRERRPRRQRPRLRRRHHQRLEDRRARGLRPGADPGRRVHRLRRRAGRLHLGLRAGSLAVGLLRRRSRRLADQAELGAVQVRRPPGSQQTALFVALKELPNNKFGTQSEIYWDDAFLNTQVGAITRGTYTLKITDPLTFIRNFVSAGVISGRGGLRLHRHRQPRRRAAVQRGRRLVGAGVLDVHQRSRQGQPDQPGSSRTRSASRSRCPRRSRRTTTGAPTAASRSSRPRSSRSSTTRTPASCSRTSSAPTPCRARAATRTCRRPSPQASSRPVRTPDPAG